MNHIREEHREHEYVLLKKKKKKGDWKKKIHFI